MGKFEVKIIIYEEYFYNSEKYTLFKMEKYALLWHVNCTK